MTVRSIRPLDLAILGVLAAGPLHPYGIQKRLKEWGKGEVVELGTRATFYKLIARLDADGLVTAEATTRDARYPERTTYAITPQGSELVQRWLTDMLSTPVNEYPLFPAALSFVPMLTPAQLRDALTRRAEALEVQRDDLHRNLAALDSAKMFPVTVLDDRYRKAILTAELEFAHVLLDELERGELTWDRDDMIAAIPPTPDMERG